MNFKWVEDNVKNNNNNTLSKKTYKSIISQSISNINQ